MFRPTLQSQAAVVGGALVQELGELKQAIASHDTKRVQAIWNANLILQGYYRGEINPITPPISDKELIENFLFALKNQCFFIAQQIWEGNRRLKVIVNICEVAVTQRCLHELLALRVSNHHISQCKALLDDFIGSLTNKLVIETAMSQLLSTSTKYNLALYEQWQYALLEARLEELFSSAKLAVFGVWAVEIDAQDNEKEREKEREEHQQKNWEEIENEVEEQGIVIPEGIYMDSLLDVMPLNDIIEQFRWSLASRNVQLLEILWDTSQSLREEYLALPANRKFIPPQEVRADFAALLDNGCERIANALLDSNPDLLPLHNNEAKPTTRGFSDAAWRTGTKKRSAKLRQEWEENSWLAQWYAGKTLDVGMSAASRLQTISLNELIHDFKEILRCRMSHIAIAIWESNSLLRAYFCGQKHHSLDEARVLSSESVIDNLILIMQGQAFQIAKDIWKQNRGIRHSLIEQDPALLARQVWIFRAALRTQCGYIAEKIWHKNTALRKSFCDDVSLQTLVMNFKSLLSSKSSSVIKGMWNESTRLPAAFLQLDVKDTKKMLRAVLYSGIPAVMSGYLNLITDAAIIRDILSEEKFQKQNNYKTVHRHGLLQERLTELEKQIKSAAPSIDQAFAEEVSVEDEGFNPDDFLSLDDENLDVQMVILPELANDPAASQRGNSWSAGLAEEAVATSSPSINNPSTFFYHATFTVNSSSPAAEPDRLNENDEELESWLLSLKSI